MNISMFPYPPDRKCNPKRKPDPETSRTQGLPSTSTKHLATFGGGDSHIVSEKGRPKRHHSTNYISKNRRGNTKST